jgi:hypothetical protein
LVKKNLEYLRKKSGLDVMPVLKANAYGHGIIEMSKICRKLGVKYIGVATLGEAIQIRNIGVARATSENTALSTVQEIKYIREEMQNLGEIYNQRVVNYLCEYSEFFPLYNAASKDMYPTNYQYDSDIYIEDRYRDLTMDELKFLKKYLS